MVYFSSFLTLSALGVLFLKLDLSSSSLILGDVVYRSSPSLWIYLALVALAVLLSCKYLGRDAVNLTPIMLSFIFIFIFQLAQYPSLAHHDYFYHGILVEVIQSEGRVVSSGSYSAYPGSFVLLSAICILTGIKPVQCEILLVSLLALLVPAMLLLIGRAILKRYAWLVPWVFLVIGQLFLVFREFSPQFPGFALYLLCLYAMVKCYKGRSRTWPIMYVLTMTALVVTHLFSSLFIISSLLVLIVLEHRKLLPVGAGERLFMLGLVPFLFWSAYVAYEYVYLGSQRALSFTFLLNMAERLMPQETAPGIVGTVLRFYRWGVLGFFYSTALVAAVKLRDREDVRLLLFPAFGVLAGVLALSLASPVLAVERGWLFSYFPVSALASVFLISWLLPKISTRPWKALGGLLRNGDVIRAVLLMMIFTSFVAANSSLSMTSVFVHQGEITAARFALQHLETAPSTSGGEFSIYAYYRGRSVTDLEYWSYPARGESMSQNATNQAERLLSGEFSLQNSVYQQMDFGFGFVGTDRSLVFNDGLNRIYMAKY